MFQSFDTNSSPQQAGARIQALRRLMLQYKLDAFLVPHADEYQGEYVPPSSQRLEWLTGFCGSAGCAVVLQQRAVLFVDGRYTVQVRQQTDASVFEYADISAMPPSAWLRNYLQIQAEKGLLPVGGFKIGFDARLYTASAAGHLRAALAPHAVLEPVAENLTDKIWHDRPAPPQNKIFLHPVALAGRAAAEKLADIRSKTQEAGADICVITDPSSLAWLFNIRGSDVPHNPVALGMAIIPALCGNTGKNTAECTESAEYSGRNKAVIFMQSDKYDKDLQAALSNVAQFTDKENFETVIKLYARQNAVFMVDKHTASEALRLQTENAGGSFMPAENPCLLPRAIKTRAEINGSRRAHLSDGVAMARFLAWLEQRIAEQGAASLDEISAAEMLENFRRETSAAMGMPLLEIAFDTISAVGEHGAVVHYRVTRATNRIFREGQLYLSDSGGQYRCGTTDITRTLAVGTPDKEQKHCFTLVLKGMIALSMARFPQGICGRDLDCLARLPLWQNGMDYAHGTGHGVGSYLNVHEGPQTISRAGMQELYAGMIISNEPGCYKEGAFGIRIENLLLVRAAEAAKNLGSAAGSKTMLEFETLTLCPIDRRLILPEILSAAELAWLNSYHAHVYARLSPFLALSERAWLAVATQKL